MNLFSLDLEKLYPQLKDKTNLLAVSGGVDSIVLAHLFSKTKFKFVIAHCNYKLRNIESDNDAFLVKKLSESLNVKFFIKEFDTILYSKQNKCSIQMAARNIRYNWFEELLAENQISNVITAHHLNDQLETFLINIGRGSGIEGLIGIPETDSLIRPLLNFTKQEIIDFANKNNLNWNEDTSNNKNEYLRNSLRNRVIPEWKKTIPDLEKKFKKTILHLGFANDALNIQIEKFKKHYFKISDLGIKINLKDINKLNPKFFFMHAIFKEYGFIYPLELEKLIKASSGKIISSKSHDLLKDRECIILRKKKDIQDKSYKIKLIPQKLQFPFDIEISLDPFEDNINSIEVDSSLLNPTLEIKRSFIGAFFYPLGMTGKKKIK
jgi:tRNA(Ile)-lysidine synthase